MADENMRRLIGLSPDEQEAMQRAMGRRIIAVEHEMLSGEGEALLIVFEGGDALSVEATAQLDLTHLSPLARQVVQMQWSNPAPAHGAPLYSVERHGSTFSMTKEPVTGWRRVLWPVYRLVLAWNSRKGI